ncbi:MAG: hypothetical protein QXT45_00015 [Candidatus Bilamarchaeaceae archaeon]
MKKIYVTLNQVSYEFREEYENIEVFLYSFVAFMIPLIFPHPQLLTGTIVNAFLIMAAFHFRGWKVLPLVMLPSVAAVLNGVLFGPFTIFLLYIIPIIWVGNFILVYLIKYIHIAKGVNYLIALGASALAKSALLFGAAFFLVNANVLPSTFLTVMGIMQLVTAIAGGIVAYGLRFAYLYLLNIHRNS